MINKECERVEYRVTRNLVVVRRCVASMEPSRGEVIRQHHDDDIFKLIL